MNRLKSERNNQVLAYRKIGMPIREIARIFKISNARVQQIIKKNDLHIYHSLPARSQKSILGWRTRLTKAAIEKRSVVDGGFNGRMV